MVTKAPIETPVKSIPPRVPAPPVVVKHKIVKVEIVKNIGKKDEGTQTTQGESEKGENVETGKTGTGGETTQTGQEAAKAGESHVVSESQDTEDNLDDLDFTSEEEVVNLHEKLDRPDELEGCTYKIKPSSYDHALYITINDITLNKYTSNQITRPFEIFINSKNTQHFQWMTALTRILSAVFRKGGDIDFIVEELHGIFDPGGGYWRAPDRAAGETKGVYVPSVLFEIGDIIKKHLKKCEQKDDQERLRQGDAVDLGTHITNAFTDAVKNLGLPADNNPNTTIVSPARAGIQCGKCYSFSVVNQSGCLTCTNCGDSKCS